MAKRKKQKKFRRYSIRRRKPWESLNSFVVLVASLVMVLSPFVCLTGYILFIPEMMLAGLPGTLLLLFWMPD